VDDLALIDMLKSGYLAGAVLDVYDQEPLPGDHPLRSAPNVLLMPHLGASTIEAQRNVAVEVCAAVRDALLRGEFSRSINAAAVEGQWTESYQELQRLMMLARRAAALAAAILADQGVKAVQRLTLRCGPDLAGGREALLAAAALGVMERAVATERLNLINARALAEARGIDLSLTESAQALPGTIEVSLRASMQELTVAGDVAGGSSPRLTNIGGYRVNVNIGGSPPPTLIVLTNRDVPGVIGRVGMLLGDERINIAEYHQARLAQGGEALAAIVVDSEPAPDLRAKLAEIPEILSIGIATFRED
jgi:D-3-phosphoglycerate dehydrogenase / 2-oxoglutarate reductase